MLIRKMHWISLACISGDKSLRQANDVEENLGPTIFDVIDPTTTVSAGSSFVETNVCNRTWNKNIDSFWEWNQSFFSADSYVPCDEYLYKF